MLVTNQSLAPQFVFKQNHHSHCPQATGTHLIIAKLKFIWPRWSGSNFLRKYGHFTKGPWNISKGQKEKWTNHSLGRTDNKNHTEPRSLSSSYDAPLHRTAHIGWVKMWYGRWSGSPGTGLWHLPHSLLYGFFLQDWDISRQQPCLPRCQLWLHSSLSMPTGGYHLRKTDLPIAIEAGFPHEKSLLDLLTERNLGHPNG